MSDPNEPVINSYWFTTQAKKCRRLAQAADERTARILSDMADEYEAKAIALDKTGESAD